MAFGNLRFVKIQFLIFLLVITYLLNFSEAAYFVCKIDSSNDEKLQSELQFEYDRDQFGIYIWNETASVNVLLSSVHVNFSGDLFPYYDIFFPMNTEIEGIAIIRENDSLTDCVFSVITKPHYSSQLDASMQSEYFQQTKSCINKELCERLKFITQEDIIRAQDYPYDFGEKTIPYIEYNQTYHNIILPMFKASTYLTREIILQASLNSAVDFVLTALISTVSDNELGFIKLPDLQEILPQAWPAKTPGYFNMTDGIIGNLKNIMRTEDVVLASDGLRFSIQSTVKLNKAKVVYDKYALTYSIIERNGSGTIEVDGVEFGIQIIVNYNTYPCTIKAGYVRSTVYKPKFKLTGSGFADVLISEIINLALNYFTTNIVSFLQRLLITTINEPLEKLDCEQFRPRLA